MSGDAAYVKILEIALNVSTFVLVAIVAYLARSAFRKIEDLDVKVSRLCNTVGVLSEKQALHDSRLQKVEDRCWECMRDIASLKKPFSPPEP